MISQRPYLFRAIYDWLLDNNWAPHILVNVSDDSVKVPMRFVKDGKIVLNISPGAIHDYFLDNELVAFSARFSGVSERIVVPLSEIEAIYAAENGMGMVFPEEAYMESDASGEELALETVKPSKEKEHGNGHVKGTESGASTTDSKATKKSNKPPSLKVVK